MANHSSIAAWKASWTEEPRRVQAMESQALYMTWRLNHTTFKFQLKHQVTEFQRRSSVSLPLGNVQWPRSLPAPQTHTKSYGNQQVALLRKEMQAIFFYIDKKKFMFRYTVSQEQCIIDTQENKDGLQRAKPYTLYFTLSKNPQYKNAQLLR